MKPVNIVQTAFKTTDAILVTLRALGGNYDRYNSPNKPAIGRIVRKF